MLLCEHTMLLCERTMLLCERTMLLCERTVLLCERTMLLCERTIAIFATAHTLTVGTSAGVDDVTGSVEEEKSDANKIRRKFAESGRSLLERHQVATLSSKVPK